MSRDVIETKERHDARDLCVLQHTETRHLNFSTYEYIMILKNSWENKTKIRLSLHTKYFNVRKSSGKSELKRRKERAMTEYMFTVSDNGGKDDACKSKFSDMRNFYDDSRYLTTAPLPWRKTERRRTVGLPPCRDKRQRLLKTSGSSWRQQ
uniref:Uncharacterized protein n=1 Tax=Romanomermis culicivorax TaxID=13658 RepID=A0A915I4M1_ROMCU